ncbi:hypothetical protein GBA65_05480 [Rubrobacter marinus]|uniref:Uncharacterized protein n=1 Tax=Rubrobacter marinus TaxID=2653852 RepID=A0A6G8PV42_9ACTN|nr:hypothetical protein [Rubrobacter marinus]QIN78057.1 hypothetical protein GBA65_05480 [Rubrobacter marinus]
MRADDVLQLMRTAPQRYETVRATLVYRGDGTKIRAVRERYARSEAGRHTFGDSPDEVWHPEPDSEFGWRCRIWRVDENQWRQELELPGGGTSIVVSTGRIRPFGTPEGPPGSSEMWELRTGEGSQEADPAWLIHPTDVFWTMYPFDPAGTASIDAELGRMELTVEEGISWAERDAVRLRGVPVGEWEYPPEPLWWGADEYEAVVDAERGVLLRLASRFDGGDIDALEVEEVRFDEPFDEEIFASRAPLP